MAKSKKAKQQVKGQPLSPKMANIIKIGMLLLVVAVAVLATIMIATLFDKKEDDKHVFNDYQHLNLADLKGVTYFEDGIYPGWVDLTNTAVKNILISLDGKDILVLFYSSKTDAETLNEEIKKIENLDKKAFFFVSLDRVPELFTSTEFAHLDFPNAVKQADTFILLFNEIENITRDNFFYNTQVNDHAILDLIVAFE